MIRQLYRQSPHIMTTLSSVARPAGIARDRLSAARRLSTGFTLLEIMVVVVILGILAEIGRAHV